MPPRATDLATRPPAVAGAFYDADPHQLGSEVRRLLARAPRRVTSVRPKAIIVPHAAYLYSGQVAGARDGVAPIRLFEHVPNELVGLFVGEDEEVTGEH